MDDRLVIMELDDNCTCSKKGSAVLMKYREEYRGVSKRVGVMLASEDNPRKAFPPSTRGEILGLNYDTEAWTWNMTDTKRERLQV